MENYFNGNNTIGFTCDVCGREIQGYTSVNGMKFCAKCYQETFGNKTIDLFGVGIEVYKLIEENKQLKQQLAEKDKEIEKYKTQIKEFCGTKLAKLIDKKEQEIRKQVCDMARKKIVEATCYDTEEEVRNVIYDLNARTALEILDQIEKGE